MSQPFFSVVVASRNRPQLLRLALDSIFVQSFQDFEVMLVNDGSDEEHLSDLQALIDEHPGRIRRIDLVRYPRGHGQSYSLNTGVYAASGKFVTFLDDDDFWTDAAHLQNAHAALQRFPESDVYYANQLAVQAGQDAAQGTVLWLAEGEQHCVAAGLSLEQRVFQVDVDLLMHGNGFAHLNCSIVRRELFLSIGGMDEDIRWECDRDFYLRTIDQARGILFNPDVVSQHNVPDKTKSANMTTAISAYQRLNYQLYVLNKAGLQACHPAIAAHARKHAVYTLKHIAERLASEGRYGDAVFFSSQALCMDASWKWWLRHLQLMFHKLTAGKGSQSTVG